MVERCALSGSDLKIKFRTILLTSIRYDVLAKYYECSEEPYAVDGISPDHPVVEED